MNIFRHFAVTIFLEIIGLYPQGQPGPRKICKPV